jgi:hypothetical protein
MHQQCWAFSSELLNFFKSHDRVPCGDFEERESVKNDTPVPGRKNVMRDE